jgi:glycerol-3-phosphate acyltransferase PlsY
LIWLLFASYIVGSIPVGLLIVWAVAGVDLRTVGSGNIGATNVGRVAGWTWALVVLMLDALKGAGPVMASTWLAPRAGFEGPSTTAAVLAGTAAILGHMFPPWLGFRGGKGVATALGVVVVLAPWGTLVAAAVFAVAFAWKRIVSLGSILAAISFGASQMWALRPNPFGAENRALALFSLAIPVLILVRHAGNIARLMRGEEPAYSFAKRSNPGSETATCQPE